MYGKALTDDDIKLIDSSSIDQLNELANKAFKDISPQQRVYCDAYLELLNEKQAAITAQYSDKSMNLQTCRLRSNYNVCLYVSCKQELEKRAKQPEIDQNHEDIELSKKVCRAIIDDGKASYTDRLNAIDKLAKLNGVYKEPVNSNKNRGYSIKKDEKMRINEQERAKQSKQGVKPSRITAMELEEEE